GAAPWHGRLLVLDTDDAKESTGHGSPLPVLVHGGPGRAGGGEEMGGIRGVLHYMQRTAVQASPRTLTAITRRWVQGAPRRGRAPVPQVAGRTGGRRLCRRWPENGHPVRYRAVRRAHRRHLLRAHRRGGGQSQPALRRDRGPWLPGRRASRRAVRRPRTWSGA